MRTNIWGVTIAAFAMLALAMPAMAQMEVDPNLPAYEKTEGVSGSIKSVGSDTMNNLMALWGEGFKGFYPGVEIEVEGKGSSTAPPALIEGTSTFGPMSRPMKSSEVDEFEAAFGYKPTNVGTAIDMVAVYVHKDNPIAKTGMTLDQVDAIFSKTRTGGYSEDITTWGQLGLEGEWADLPISVYGRNSASGTYAFFKKHALFGGDYKDTVKEQPGSSAVVQGIANDKGGIGYSGIGYRTPDVAVVPLSKEGTPVPADAEHAGEYPLARFLYLYVNYKPGTDLDPLRAEFLKFVFSKQGQEVVIQDGYLPLTAKVAKDQLAKAGLD